MGEATSVKMWVIPSAGAVKLSISQELTGLSFLKPGTVCCQHRNMNSRKGFLSSAYVTILPQQAGIYSGDKCWK